MNMPTASREGHVDVARQPGYVPMMSWTKIRRLSSTKPGKNNISTTSKPTSSLQKHHLAPAANAVVDNNKCQPDTEKLISPDLKNGEKTKLSI
jgi:hypothetical protein